MKKKFLVMFLLITLSISSYGQYVTHKHISSGNRGLSNSNQVESNDLNLRSTSKYKNNNGYVEYNPIGWGYTDAKVTYYNLSTDYVAKYSLEVKIEGNRVTQIIFSDGGYIGTSSSNGKYEGGYLDVERNFYGDVVSITTTATFTDSNGKKVFEINLY